MMWLSNETVLNKAIRIGVKRTAVFLHHQQEARHMRLRQTELATFAFFNLIFFALSGHRGSAVFFVVIAMACIGCGTREAIRFRACGRVHQCRRSLEVIGV